MSVSAKWLRVTSAWVTRHRVPLAVMLGALAVGAAIWLVSPTTNKVYNFALLSAAAAAALLSAIELVRAETHQREATRQLDDLAGLLGVRVSLKAGFAGASEGQVLDEIGVTPDWTDRAGPAIKRSIPGGVPFGAILEDLYEKKERASDLVDVSFRVSNVGGRDPATNVLLVVGLPEGWEAYAESEFETLPLVRHPNAAHPEWGPEVNEAEDRRRITFGATSIVNGAWVTMEWIWIRVPPSSSGTFNIKYSLTAERVSPIFGQLMINVQEGQAPLPA